MTSRPQDWIGAASCCEGPRPGVTFADIPPEYRHDLRVVAFAAALSSAYFVTLGILLQPIPSRSLAGPALMPNPAPRYSALLGATAVIPLDAPPRRPSRALAPRPLEATQLAGLREPPVADTRTPSVAASPERRPTFLGRLMRGAFRTIHPTGPKANVP